MLSFPYLYLACILQIVLLIYFNYHCIFNVELITLFVHSKGAGGIKLCFVLSVKLLIQQIHNFENALF